MTHEHLLQDDDSLLFIDPNTRNISSANGGEITLMQYDHNSEKITFVIPRMIDGHDMSLCNRVRIHYVNESNGTSSGARSKNSGLYLVRELLPFNDDPDQLIFDWVISQNATLLAGSIKIQIEFICDDPEIENKILYAWRTNIYSEIVILPGLDAANEVVEQYPDALERYKSEIKEMLDAYITDVDTLIGGDT